MWFLLEEGGVEVGSRAEVTYCRVLQHPHAVVRGRDHKLRSVVVEILNHGTYMSW